MTCPDPIDPDLLALYALWYEDVELQVTEACPLPWLWLGAQDAFWAWSGKARGPLLIEAGRMREKWPTRRRKVGMWKTEPRRSTVPVILDSGAFSMIAKHGDWVWKPRDYIAFVRRARDALGHDKVHFIATQDWMCEPDMLRRTGLSLAEHQRRTVRSFHELRDLAPELPLLPALQGHSGDDYLACGDMYEAAGVSLADLRLVGLGSVCRRSGTLELEQVIDYITARLPGVNLHGYGVKSDGAVLSCLRMRSLDSQAGSRRGRYAERDLRAAVGLPPTASWPDLVAAMAERSPTVDMDLVDLFEWKRDHGETASIANSIAWAEHWRAKQQMALAVAAQQQAVAACGPPVPVQLRLL